MTNHPTPVRPSRGIALVAALIFSTTILALAASMLVTGYAAEREKRAMVAAQHAQEAAESGVHMSIVQLNTRTTGLLTGGVNLLDALRGLGDAAKRFVVDALPALDDGADNDLDGAVDEEDEADVIEVTSSGTYDRVTRTVRATLVPRFRIPRLKSVIYIGDIFATVGFSGNSYLISGQETTLLGGLLPGMGGGVGVAGDPTNIAGQISGKVLLNIVGSPKVGQVERLDLQALVDEGARAASVR
ncbi:MAG: hypothetical protein ACREID_00025, partial [Planctomycetota bacterium]